MFHVTETFERTLSVKRGGTAGYVFIPVPASYLPWQVFYLFGRFSLCFYSQSFGAGAPMKILLSKKAKVDMITVK